MQASTITKALVAASATNIATSQTPLAAGFLTLNGSAVSGGVATLDTQRRIILTSAGNDSGLTWTVIGTNEGGSAIKDVFAGANGVAQSNLDFLTITSIYGSGATASTVTAGTNTVGSSPWKLFDNYIGTPNMKWDVAIPTGAANYSVEYTDEAFLAVAGTPIQFANANPNPKAYGVTGLTALAVAADASISNSIHAWRLTINSGTGTVTCTGRQSGLVGG